MKIVRKPAPMVKDDPAMGRVERAVSEVRDAIAGIKPVELKFEPHIDAPKPLAFTVTVTKRDSAGRIAEFDVRVRGG